MQWYTKNFLLMAIGSLLCLIGYSLLLSGLPESWGFFASLIGFSLCIVGAIHWLVNVIVIELEKGGW